MRASLSRWVSQQSNKVATATDRRDLLDRGLDVVHGTALAPTPYELRLLNRFVLGQLSIARVLARLEAHQASQPAH